MSQTYKIRKIKKHIVNAIQKKYGDNSANDYTTIFKGKGRTYYINNKLKYDNVSIKDILFEMYKYRNSEIIRNPSELLYLLFHKSLQTPDVCKNCNINYCNFKGINRGYTQFCSDKCSKEYEKSENLKMNNILGFIETQELENKPKETKIRKKITKNSTQKKIVNNTIRLQITSDGYIRIRDKSFKTFISSVSDENTNYSIKCLDCNVVFTLKSVDLLEKCPFCENKDKDELQLKLNNITKIVTLESYKTESYESNSYDAEDVVESEKENEMYEFVKSISKYPVIKNCRNTIAPKELDMIIEAMYPRVAIEHDGNYPHSELKGRDKFYHYDKTMKCINNDIFLLHFWGDDWKIKRNKKNSDSPPKATRKHKIIRRMIMDALQYKPENCKERGIVSHTLNLKRKEAEVFFTNNHIDDIRLFQNYNLSFIGLNDSYGDLVSVFAVEYDTDNITNAVDIKIVRWASRIDIYLYENPFEYFCSYIKKTCRNQDLKIHYLLELRHDNIFYYKKLGMVETQHIEPDFRYYQYNLHKSYDPDFITDDNIQSLVKNYDSTKTNEQNLYDDRFTKIWDAGKILMTLTQRKNTYVEKSRSQETLF